MSGAAGLDGAVPRGRRLPALAAAAAAAGLALLWLAGLGGAPLFDVDEGAFAQASREMLASGDWGHTTLNGEDRFDKPILVYWLQAASLALLGATEAAARLPSALCALATGLATAAFLAPRLGAGAAGHVPWLLASAVGPAAIGRAATADALLGLLIALAAFDLWRCLEADAAALQRRALRRAALWIGLGLLAKGPVALLVPGLPALGWVLLQPQRERTALLRRLLGDLPAWALLGAVALPWYAWALARHGRAFVDGFFVRHHLERIAGPLEGHGGGLLYFAFVLPLLLLPWTPLLLGSLPRLAAAWGRPLPRYLMLWAGTVFLLFTLAGTKLPHYGLYGAVPLLALAAWRLAGGLSRAMAAWVAGAAVLLAALALASPWLAAQTARHAADAFWQARLQHAQAVGPVGGLAAACALACVLLGLRACWSARRRSAALVACALAATLAWTGAAWPWWGAVLQGPVRDLARQAAAHPQPLVQWRLHQPSAAFYAGTVAPRRAPRPGELALARADRVAELPPPQREALDVIGSAGGFVLVLQR